MKRKTGIVGGALSALLAVALGSGLLSSINDSAASEGDRVESNQFSAPINIEIASTYPNAGCDNANFRDGPITQVIASSADLNNDNWASSSGLNLCVRNNTPRSGIVSTKLDAALATEVGACSSEEEFFEGTASCSSGSAGELQDALRYVLSPVTSGCGTASGRLTELISGTPVTLGLMSSGAVREYKINLTLRPSATTTARGKGSTDRVQWDTTFVLEESGPTEAEPNDTSATATPMAVDSYRNGAIQPIGDADYYSFDWAGGQVAIDTIGLDDTSCTVNTFMELFDGADVLVTSDDNGGTNSCSAIVATLPADTYRVRISEPGDDAALSAYRLRIADVSAEAEPNDTFATAVSMTGSVRGAIGPVGDQDVFSVSWAGGPMVIETTGLAGTGCEGDTLVRLSDATQVQLAEDDDAGNGVCSKITTDQPAGTYYVSVRHYNDTELVPRYRLNVS